MNGSFVDCFMDCFMGALVVRACTSKWAWGTGPKSLGRGWLMQLASRD